MSAPARFPRTIEALRAAGPGRPGSEVPHSRDLERHNGFDVLRLGLAALVVYSHACLLGGFGTEGFEQVTRSQAAAGTFAVLGFFGISGFLIARSFDTRGEVRAFCAARLLRILPGFYVALLLTAFVAAPLIAQFNGTSWTAAAAARFVTDNALVRLGNWHVGDVTHGLPYDGSINGALWSLFPELCCYAGVLLLGVLGLLRRGTLNVLALLAVLVAFNAALVVAPGTANLAPTVLQLTKVAPFVTAFAAGTCAYCLREHLALGRGGAVLWGGLAVVLLKFGGWQLAGPVVLPLALIHLAYSFQVRLPADLSYGTYVLHFPILQVLAAAHVNRVGFVAFFAIALLTTAAAAYASWTLIEAPALRLKSRLAKDRAA